MPPARGGASERARIDLFTTAFAKVPLPQGPGDDCAVLPPSGQALCVTTDAVVEGVHFTFPHFSFADVGHKALAVNVSDLASMGARPAWFVCAVAHPASFGVAPLRQLARGMAALAREVGIRLVGGNFARAGELSVTITAAGSVPPGRALLRSGAREGDRLFVSGTLGDARLGLRQLQAGLRRSAAIARQKRPTPRVALGALAQRFASAAMDLSDGLAQDLPRLCEASQVGARVEVASLPVGPAVRSAFKDAGQAASFALAGGEDYELLVAVPPAKAGPFLRACERAGEQVTAIGVVTGARSIDYLDADGAPVNAPGGFEHFTAGGRASGARRI